MRTFERQADETVPVPASSAEIFSFIDDHKRLSSHMSKRSWMMGGSRMSTEIDELQGQAVGSHIRMSGKAFGVPISLDEVVAHRDPPRAKSWETVGTPRLLVIGPYRMSVDLDPVAGTRSTSVRVGIDYDLPTKHRWLGTMFGDAYAKWCVRQMVTDLTSQFPA